MRRVCAFSLFLLVLSTSRPHLERAGQVNGSQACLRSFPTGTILFKPSTTLKGNFFYNIHNTDYKVDIPYTDTKNSMNTSHTLSPFGWEGDGVPFGGTSGTRLDSPVCIVH